MKRKYSNRKLIHAVLTGLAFTFMSTGGGHAFAAPSEETDKAIQEHALDETVVTATRTPVEDLKANANVTVITGKDIEKRHYTDLKQALRDVPGVIVNQYAPAGYNNSDAIYINGSSDVVILVDGVRQNYAGGSAASLAATMKDLSGIERIEVLHGSASTLYGSDAKGGVINIITKKVTGQKTTLEAAYGSFGKQLYSVAHEGTEDGWDWRMKYQKDKSGDFKDGNGETTPSELDADSINFHFGRQLDKSSYVAFNLHSYQEGDLYQALYEKKKGMKPKTGNYDHIAGNIVWNWTIDDTAKNQMVLARSKYDYNAGGYGLGIWSWKFSDQFDKKVDDHLLTAGFEFTKDTTTGTQLSNRDLLNRSFYLQDQWSIVPALKFIAGVRYDKNSAFGSHASPSFSLGYDITPTTHAYVSYSEYFLTPTPSNLYSSRYGNPNLKPETGDTREIGVTHDFGSGFNLAAHYFKRSSENRIGYSRVTNKYANVGDEKAHGWDVQLAKRFDSHVRARFGYTHTNVGKTEQRAANVDGYIPKGQVALGVDYKNRQFDASLLARGMIDRPGPQTADVLGNFFPEDSYWVFDLALNYKVAAQTKIYLKVNNLFDKFYAEHSNARRNWWGNPNEWWSAPGRSFLVGVEHSF